MEWYIDNRKDEIGGLKDSIMDGNREKMMKFGFLPRRLTIF